MYVNGHYMARSTSGAVRPLASVAKRQFTVARDDRTNRVTWSSVDRLIQFARPFGPRKSSAACKRRHTRRPSRASAGQTRSRTTNNNKIPTFIYGHKCPCVCVRACVIYGISKRNNYKKYGA